MQSVLNANSLSITFAPSPFCQYADSRKAVIKGKVKLPSHGECQFDCTVSGNTEDGNIWAECFLTSNELGREGLGQVENHIALKVIEEFRKWMERTSSDLDEIMVRVKVSDFDNY